MGCVSCVQLLVSHLSITTMHPTAAAYGWHLIIGSPFIRGVAGSLPLKLSEGSIHSNATIASEALNRRKKTLH